MPEDKAQMYYRDTWSITGTQAPQNNDKLFTLLAQKRSENIGWVCSWNDFMESFLNVLQKLVWIIPS